MNYEILFNNNSNNPDFDPVFLNTIKTENTQKEQIMLNNKMQNEHNIMSDHITLEEVNKVVKHAKSGKAAGYDGLPNEVYKNESSVQVLWRLFNMSFKCSLIPITWKRAVIKLIPKGSKYDPCVQLNYSGNSFLTTMYK